MFTQARLKLTAWYLMIIMLISIGFSLVIHRVSMNELDRFTRMQRNRLEDRYRNQVILISDTRQPFPEPPYIDMELINEVKKRINITLVVINTSIFIIAGGIGYFLAGKTLSPIENMMTKQNQFISDASHELRTPLTSLKSSFEVNLRDKDLNLDQAKTVIKESVDEVNKIQRLTDSLLDMARYQKLNKQNFKLVYIDAIVNQSIEKIKLTANNKQIKIVNKTRKIKIPGIENDLVNAFANILDNAIKYSPARSTISISSRSTDSQVNIEIKDQGMGIDKKDLPYIFDRFYRVDQSRSKTKISGYGLGLSIVKNIIDNHHGKILVSSKLNKGTVFTIILPISG